jgi:hypothetical protein
MSEPQPEQAAAPRQATRFTGVAIWAAISVVVMAIGAFGPWIKGPLGISVSGTDGSNDGWIVVVCAVVAALLLYEYVVHNGGRLLPLLALVAGIAATATTIYDRNNVSDKLKFQGTQIGQIGWGLNAAMVASISLAIVSFVLATGRRPGR